MDKSKCCHDPDCPCPETYADCHCNNLVPTKEREMKYMGSKNRIAKEVLPIILKDRLEAQYYIEPFIGGCNAIDKVDGKRMGCDVNKYLVAFIKKLQNDWLPPKVITEREYIEIKNNIDKYPDYLVGYAGFQLSYGAMWFSNYRKDSIGKRDYSNEAFRNIKKQAPKLKGIELFCCPYNELTIPDESIVYCDPPYQGTAKYKANKDDFDHNKFWQWCRDKTKEGHQVFISEYEAPDDFKCVWEKEIVSSLTKNTGSKRGIEKLFIFAGE